MRKGAKTATIVVRGWAGRVQLGRRSAPLDVDAGPFLVYRDNRSPFTFVYGPSAPPSRGSKRDFCLLDPDLFL
eukprot:2513744-Prymnesium_polylepis.2